MSIHREISALSKIAREKRKRRRTSVVGKPSCAFSGCGMFCLLNSASRCVPTLKPPSQTEYVRFHRATTADPGDDAGRAGTARAPAAEAEGPEARKRSPHPRGTTCARNTALTSGVEYCICYLSGDNTALSSTWIPCSRSIPLSLLCSRYSWVFIYLSLPFLMICLPQFFFRSRACTSAFRQQLMTNAG